MEYNVTLSELNPALSPEQFCRILNEVQPAPSYNVADSLFVAMTNHRLALGANWILSVFAHKHHEHKVCSANGFNYYITSQKDINRLFEDANEARQKFSSGTPEGLQACDSFWKSMLEHVPYVYDVCRLMKPDDALWHLYVARLDAKQYDSPWRVIKTNIIPTNNK